MVCYKWPAIGHEAEQRPWIEVARVAPVPFAERNELVYFDIGVDSKNLGSAPAHDVETVAKIIRSESGQWRSRVVQACDKQRRELEGSIPPQSFTVMPNGTLHGGVKGETVLATDLADPSVVGCVFYRWRANKNSVHQTGFVAPLHKPKGSWKTKSIYMINPY
jgi:hypothetical protein